MKGQLQPITTALTVSQIIDLDAMAEGRSRAVLIREAVQEYIDRQGCGGCVPDEANLARVSDLLQEVQVAPGVICIENYRLGVPMRTPSTGAQCGWGRKHGCRCGDGADE